MRLTISALIFVSFTVFLSAQIKFDEYFIDGNMRIDYHHTGNDELELISIDNIYLYGTWAGNPNKTIDNFNNGRYYIKIYDEASGNLIYSKGFDSYFGEYQLSSAAADKIVKSFHETALIPQPKNTIIFAVEKRNFKNELAEIFRTKIDPASFAIIKDPVIDPEVKVFEVLKNGDPHYKVDIAVVAEGYTSNEFEKFEKDLNRFSSAFFKQEPYNSLKDKFNIYGIMKPSMESGVDEPRADIFKNTVLSATFNSLESERYLLTEDNKLLRNIAAHAPYDALFIMVNHSRYGGGGIYNFYCTFTSDNQFFNYLLVHEFGHSFTGLADEYYTSAVAYNDFYPRGIEPVEHNITALLDKDNVKWKAQLSDGIEIPTPWEKADYDSMDLKWQAERRMLNDKIAELKRTGASKEKIEAAENEYAIKDRAHSDKVDAYLQSSKFFGKVGVFEGAGYSSEGLYRSMLDCIMFSKGDKPFCKVCQSGIEKVIFHYLN